MYDIILSEPNLMEKYLDAQQFTWSGKATVARVWSQIADKKDNCRILLAPADVGHYYSLLRRECPGAEFVLLDKSPRALAHIAANYSMDRTISLTLPVEKASNIGVKMDIVCCFFGCHLFDDVMHVLGEFRNVLKARGQLFILTMTPEQEKKHPLGQFFGISGRFWSRDRWNQMLRDAGFAKPIWTDINHVQTLRKSDIPIAFSGFANSFLYSKSEDEVCAFHKKISTMSSTEEVHLKFRWSLVMCRKGEMI